MSIGDKIKRLFVSHNGQSYGTQFWTWRRGTRVGADAAGNIYYRNADNSRRWVIYNGEAEASRVSPEWHGWLHHTWDEPPTDLPLPHQPWEKAHLPNLTGTDAAYAPAGSIRRATPAPREDYEAWRPE